MPALALDIGTYTIKAIHGSTGKEVEIKRAVEIFNSLGSAVPNNEAVAQKMIEMLEAMLTDHKLPRGEVRLSLPETVVSTKIIELPVLTDAELASAIGWQAEQYIPIPPEQLSLEYQVLYRPDNGKQTDSKMRVLLVGAHREIVESYINVFLALGIEPDILETQVLSVIRSLGIEEQDPPTLVVHMGSSSTQMAMYAASELKFVTSHMSGGQLLTQTIEKQINLDLQQSEQYKRSYGLDPQHFEGKVKAILTPIVDSLVGEMRKAMTFYTNQNPGTSVPRILLSGGAAQLPGLVQYITESLGTEVLVAAPFSTASGEIPEGNHPAWTVCMGLLMREEA